MDIPIFAGQGTAGTPAARTQALHDARAPSAATLLSACHAIFHAELGSLSPQQLSLAAIELADFKTRESLLDAPAVRYEHNPIISGTTLFLIQALRFLRFTEDAGVADGSLTSFSDGLKRSNGVLGFSSGMLAACVVAASADLVSYISHAVEAYRLALWVGVRTQIYRATILDQVGIPVDDDAPWSLVILGVSQGDAEELIRGFQTPSSLLYITAVMDSTCVTVSGRPDVLAEFLRTLGSQYVVYKTGLDTLYHAPVHAVAVHSGTAPQSASGSPAASAGL